jgi:hypothetical protein
LKLVRNKRVQGPLPKCPPSKRLLNPSHLYTKKISYTIFPHALQACNDIFSIKFIFLDYYSDFSSTCNQSHQLEVSGLDQRSNSREGTDQDLAMMANDWLFAAAAAAAAASSCVALP